ncbi:MAG: acyltransferase [Erysipelotrichales bacterium]|nr:acyltransferase [Erysipelotrichales bacterium]
MEKNDGIQFLRGVLILIIMFFHYIYRFGEIYSIKTINFPTLSTWGRIGVGAFFIISGFLMVPQKKNQNFSILKYILKKVLRFLPSYILAITIIYIAVSIFTLPGREVTFFDYLLNIPLINGFIGVEYVDGAHWYLTYLVLFYLIVGIYIKFFYNKKLYFVILIIVKDLFYIFSYKYAFFSIFYNFLGQNYLELIFLGILLKDLLNSKMSLRFDFFCLIFCFLHYFYFSGKTCALSYLLFFVLFMFLFINKKEMKSNIFCRFGDISFILYLIHQNLGYIIILKLCSIYGSYSLWYVLIAFIIIICITIFIYEIFEKRIQLEIKKLVDCL